MRAMRVNRDIRVIRPSHRIIASDRRSDATLVVVAVVLVVVVVVVVVRVLFG